MYFLAANHCRSVKGINMVSKFSSAQNAPAKDASADKPKETSPASQPTTKPDEKPAVVTPAPKS